MAASRLTSLARWLRFTRLVWSKIIAVALNNVHLLTREQERQRQRQEQERQEQQQHVRFPLRCPSSLSLHQKPHFKCSCDDFLLPKPRPGASTEMSLFHDKTATRHYLCTRPPSVHTYTRIGVFSRPCSVHDVSLAILPRHFSSPDAVLHKLSKAFAAPTPEGSGPSLLFCSTIACFMFSF